LAARVVAAAALVALPLLGAVAAVVAAPSGTPLLAARALAL
jgi:hypothetical protein